jgi:hypothetical protein
MPNRGCQLGAPVDRHSHPALCTAAVCLVVEHQSLLAPNWTRVQDPGKPTWSKLQVCWTCFSLLRWLRALIRQIYLRKRAFESNAASRQMCKAGSSSRSLNGVRSAWWINGAASGSSALSSTNDRLETSARRSKHQDAFVRPERPIR